MTTTPALRMTMIACTGALASCAGPSLETHRIPVSGASKQDPSLAGQLLKEVNAYRRNHGAQELQRHAGLDRLAQQHCEYLRQNRGKLGVKQNKNISHFGFEGRALLARQSYDMPTCAENVASTSNTGGGIAPALVKIWTSSKSHEKNIMNDWTHTGIGIVKDSDGTVFSTQLFGMIGYSQMTARNRFNGY